MRGRFCCLGARRSRTVGVVGAFLNHNVVMTRCEDDEVTETPVTMPDDGRIAGLPSGRRMAMGRLAALALGTACLLLSLPARADALVADIQEALNRLGFDAGSADGVAGSRTERAIEAFQKEFGYTPDGRASGQLLQRLNAAIARGAASPERMLRRSGMLRSYTRAVQEALTAHGYDPGPVDGAIGPKTREAIRAYQAANGLSQTGEVSRDLLAHLMGLG